MTYHLGFNSNIFVQLLLDLSLIKDEKTYYKRRYTILEGFAWVSYRIKYFTVYPMHLNFCRFLPFSRMLLLFSSFYDFHAEYALNSASNSACFCSKYIS
jgi:hypothetical protein